MSIDTAITLLTDWTRGESLARHSGRTHKAGIQLSGSDMAARRFAGALDASTRRRQAEPGGGVFASCELPPI